MLLNLASVINADNPAMLWGFLQRYAPDVTPESHPLVARLIERAVAYYRDRVAPNKQHRNATPAEAEAMRALAAIPGVTVHGTHNLRVENNVTYNTVGPVAKSLYAVPLPRRCARSPSDPVRRCC